MPAPVRAAVTGAPGAGKSTLLSQVSTRGIATGPEVARQILQAPGGMELRRTDPVGFAHAMLDAQLALWESLKGRDVPVLFDRGFPDIVGFLDVAGLQVPDRLDQVCRTHRYDGPIFHAPAWQEIYRQDEERIQTFEEAIASDEAVTAAWRRYGYDLMPLPLDTAPVRASFVMDRLC